MNNTCRIAGGQLGALLAKQRSTWDFSAPDARLTSVGLYALWLVVDKNSALQKLVLRGNSVGTQYEDSSGMAKMFSTCTALAALDLSENNIGALKGAAVGLRQFARGLSTNKSLTDINLASNQLWPEGIKAVCGALHNCSSLKQLNLSYNHPGRESAVADLLRVHKTLQSLAVIEATPKTRIERSFHLDARGKEAIGRALIESPTMVKFLQCDVFSLFPDTASLDWTSSDQCDAVLLAGALKTNDTLTGINMGVGGELGDFEREEIGKALLRNRHGRVGFCNIFSLQPDGPKAQKFNLKDKSQVRSTRSFMMLAGLMRGNNRLTSLELKGLASDHIPLLAEALRFNTTLEELRLVHAPKANETNIASLPVQQLNGHVPTAHIDLWEAGTTTGEDGTPAHSFLHRAAVGIVGPLLSLNQAVQSLRMNPGAGSEGGNVLEHLNAACKSSLRALDLTGIGLGDRGGPRLCELLIQGSCSMLTTLKLGSNKLTDSGVGGLFVDVLRSETCSLKSLDISGNELSGAVIASGIRSNTSLVSLDFRDNPNIDDQALWIIGGLLLDDDCKCYLGSLRCHAFDIAEDATTLSLRDVPLSAGAARLVFGVIKYNSSVTDLDLSGCNLMPQTLANIAKAINSNVALKTLDLSRNPLAEVSKFKAAELEHATSPARLFAAALHVAPSLERLSFSGDAPLQLKQVKGLTNLKVLDLSNQNLDLLSGITIGALIAKNDSITELSLHNNVALGADGSRAIVESLPVANLRTLDLNAVISPITGTGVVAARMAKQRALQLEQFSAALGRLSSIEKLTLDKNSLLEFNAAAQLHDLKTLTLNGNLIEVLPVGICFLKSLKRLAIRGNRLLELPPNIGQLESLESLDLKGNKLAFLPSSIGQLCFLKHLDISENLISQLDPCICDCVRLERFEVKQNPLAQPPLSTAKMGMQAIRRFFQELNRSGEAASQGARLVLLGHGEAGKTSLQRGLRYGAPHPAAKDERTVQLDISTLPLGEGANQVLMSMWDLGGQEHYASLLQPYIVTGSLYLLLVPHMEIKELEAGYNLYVGRWLDYLQTRAPGAVVQPVLTHCDATLRRDREWTVSYMEAENTQQVEWLSSAIQRHQRAFPDDAKKLLIPEQVLCVSSVEGGDASLRHLRSRLELLQSL